MEISKYIFKVLYKPLHETIFLFKHGLQVNGIYTKHILQPKEEINHYYIFSDWCNGSCSYNGGYWSLYSPGDCGWGYSVKKMYQQMEEISQQKTHLKLQGMLSNKIEKKCNYVTNIIDVLFTVR